MVLKCGKVEIYYVSMGRKMARKHTRASSNLRREKNKMAQSLHKLSFKYTGDLMTIDSKSILFKFFLIFQILFASFRLKNLTMVFFGLILGNHWQSSMLEESISTSTFLNKWRAVSSSSEFSIDLGRPLSSKLSSLEY